MERSAVFQAAAKWLRDRKPDENLEFRIELARFAESWTTAHGATPAANDFGKAIVKTFESESPVSLKNAIRWISTDKSLPAFVPQQVLFERSIRWLRKLIVAEPIEQTKPFLSELDRLGAFPDWCWCPFLALVREQLNPIDFDWIPDVTSTTCTEPNRYAGLWTLLWESGNHDRLLESYAQHVATHCNDEDQHSLFLGNRAIARSGNLKKISSELPAEKLKVVLRTIDVRLRSTSSADFSLFSDVAQLCDRLSKAGHPRNQLKRLAGIVVDKVLRDETGQQRIESARLLDMPGTLSLIDVDQFKPRFRTWFQHSVELLSDGQLAGFMQALPRQVSNCDDWQWFVFDRLFFDYSDQCDNSLLPDVGHLPIAKAGTHDQYRRLWQFLLDRNDFETLNRLSEVVVSHANDRQLSVNVFCPAMCGHVDLLPDPLPEQELEESLSQLVEWAKPGTDFSDRERMQTLLQFLKRHREAVSRSEKSQGLVRQYLLRISDKSLADHEASVFANPVIEDIFGTRAAGTQLLAWLAKRFQSERSGDPAVLRAFLPEQLIRDEENAWRFFELVVQNKIDAVAFDALPDVGTLPQASPVYYRMLWQHLRDFEHHEKLFELTKQVADRFGDVESLSAHLQSILDTGSPPNIQRLQCYFARQDVQKLLPQIRDSFAREAMRHIVSRINPESIHSQRGIDSAIEQFCQIDFLPLANPTSRAVEFRKIIGNFQLIPDGPNATSAAENLQRHIPDFVPFDPLWSMHRAVILKRRGIRLDQSEIERACDATPKPDALSLAEIVLACRSLEELGEFDRLRLTAEQGLQIACDSRLYAAYAVALNSQGSQRKYVEAAEAATRGWILSDISGSPDPRFVSILFKISLNLSEHSGKEPGQLSAASPFTTAEKCIRYLGERLAIDSVELSMLNSMFRLHEGKTADAREIIELILGNRIDSDDLWAKRERVFFDFLRLQCADHVRIETLAEIDIRLLPKDWSISLAQSLVNAGRFSDATPYADKVLSADPDDIDGLLLKARIAIAEFKTSEAMGLSRKILSIDPNHLRAQSLYISALRLSGKRVSELVQVVRDWAETMPSKNRQESLVRRLFEVNFPSECFLESWDSFQQNDDSAVAIEFVGRSLNAMGECGLAEFFLRRSLADSAKSPDYDGELATLVQKTDQLRTLMGQDSISENESLKACQELSTLLQSQHDLNEIVLLADSPQPLTPARRLLLPAALMRFALEIAPDHSSDAGPVVLVSASLGAGGAERQIVYTARGLSAKLVNRDDLVVLCTNLGEQHGRAFFLPELEANGIRVETAGSFRNGIDTESGNETDNESPLPKLLELWPDNKGGAIIANYFAAFKHLKPRVVLASQDETNIFAGFAALLAGVPRIVLSGRSLNPGYFSENSAWMKYAYQVLLKKDHIKLINNSQAGASDYCRWLELPDETAAVIYNGFDFKAIDARLKHSSSRQVKRTLSIPGDAMIVGAVLRMHKIKRPDYCLNIIFELLKLFPKLYGLMVGDGPLWQDLVDAANNSEFADRIRFPGSIQPVEPTMAAMDVLLLASEVEGLPNVLVEAQSVGTMVASTDVGGASETFLPGTSGVIIPGDNARTAAGIIAEWIGDKDRIKQAGEAAKQHAREHFSSDRMIEATIEMLCITKLVDNTSDSMRESHQ